MAVNKTIRFEVFKRDGFQCRYCGQTPPAVILEVDHVLARANGGDDAIENLITACFDCNRGKGARDLNVSIRPLSETAEEMAERARQLRAYRKVLKETKQAIEEEVNQIEGIYKEAFDNKWSFSPRFRTSVRKHFLSKLPVEELIDAMEIAIAKGLDSDRSLKYFCGVAWKRIKERQEASNAH